MYCKSLKGKEIEYEKEGFNSTNCIVNYRRGIKENQWGTVLIAQIVL